MNGEERTPVRHEANAVPHEATAMRREATSVPHDAIAVPHRAAAVDPVAEIRDLRVEVDGRAIVDGVSLRVLPGTVTALVGASGSGKTTTGLALLGEYPAGARVTGDVQVRADGHVTGDVVRGPPAWSVTSPSTRPPSSIPPAVSRRC